MNVAPGGADGWSIFEGVEFWPVLVPAFLSVMVPVPALREDAAQAETEQSQAEQGDDGGGE